MGRFTFLFFFQKKDTNYQLFKRIKDDVAEANISMVEIDLETKDNRSRITNCDIFFFCIQWIRLASFVLIH